MQRSSTWGGPAVTHEGPTRIGDGRRSDILVGFGAWNNNHNGHGEQRNGPTHDYRRYSDHSSNNVMIKNIINLLTSHYQDDCYNGRHDIDRRVSDIRHRQARRRFWFIFLLVLPAMGAGISIGVFNGTLHRSSKWVISSPVTDLLSDTKAIGRHV